MAATDAADGHAREGQPRSIRLARIDMQLEKMKLERWPTLRDKVEPSVMMIDPDWVLISRPWHIQ